MEIFSKNITLRGGITDTDKLTSLFNYGNIHQRYYTRVEMTDTDECASLLNYGNDYAANPRCQYYIEHFFFAIDTRANKLVCLTLARMYF